MATLTEKKCQPCQGIGQPLDKEAIARFLALTPGWQVDEEGKAISREFIMKDFMNAVLTINRIAEIAEEENHHPDVHLTQYRKLKIILSTHEIGGLSENDFILAAKIDRLPMELKK